MSAAVAQPRRAVATASCMFPSPRTECASVEHTIGTPASIADSDVHIPQVEPAGQGR